MDLSYCGTPPASVNVYDLVVRHWGAEHCAGASLEQYVPRRFSPYGIPLNYPKPVFWLGASVAARDATIRALHDLVAGPPEALPLAASPGEMTMASLRQRVYQHLHASLGDASSPVYGAARRLEGARELIRAYARLGLPQALAADDGLRSTIDGADLPIGSVDTVRARYNAARSDPPASGAADLVGSAVSAGRTVFADAIKAHIGSADGLSKANPVLGPTLDRLSLAKSVLTQPAPLGPAPAIGVPVAGAVYTQGGPVRAAFACPEGRFPGDVVCTAPVASGQIVDTSSLGAKTFTVTSTDRDGFAFTRTAGYTVVASPPPPPPSPAPGGENGTAGGTAGSGGTGSQAAGGGTGSGGSGADAPEPVRKAFALSRLSLLKKAFPAAKGTKLRFTLDRATTVKVALERLAGRKRRAAGAKSLKGRAGKNSLAFGRGLKPGRYIATVVAGSGAQATKPLNLKFTVRR